MIEADDGDREFVATTLQIGDQFAVHAHVGNNKGAAILGSPMHCTWTLEVVQETSKKELR